MATAALATPDFRRLAPSSADYATLPIHEGFNWADCLAAITEGEWYLVVFRSLRRETADAGLLTAYDERAHDEARAAPGFLFYFKGCLGVRRECLSFCLWESRAQARVAARGRLHVAATRITGAMYEWYRLERYVLRKGSAGDGDHVSFERLS